MTDPEGNTSEFSPDLIFVGSSGNDQLTFRKSGSNGLEVEVGGVVQGAFIPTGADIGRKFSVFGLGGNDAIRISWAPTSGVFVDGQGGADTYTIDFGNLLGTVTVNDSGATGSDAIIANGTNQNDTIHKTPGQIKLTVPQIETILHSGMESETVHGGLGNDTIVDPGENTFIFGDEGDDIIYIDATTGSGVVVDGGQGSNSVVVSLGSLAGPVTFSSAPGVGSNSLTILGTLGPDVINASGNQVTSGTESITILTPLANLSIEGGGGDNRTEVSALTPVIASLAIVGGTGSDTVVLNNVGASVGALVVDGGSSGSNQLVVVGTLPANTVVSNLAPTAFVTSTAARVTGQTLFALVKATDPDPLDQIAGFTYTIHWNDGSSPTVVLPTAGNGAGVEVPHVFAQTGTFTIQVTATDASGATSYIASQLVTVSRVLVESDPLVPGKRCCTSAGQTRQMTSE